MNKRNKHVSFGFGDSKPNPPGYQNIRCNDGKVQAQANQKGSVPWPEAGSNPSTAGGKRSSLQ